MRQQLERRKAGPGDWRSRPRWGLANRAVAVAQDARLRSGRRVATCAAAPLIAEATFPQSTWEDTLMSLRVCAVSGAMTSSSRV